MTGEKMLSTLSMRLSDTTLAEVDAYVTERGEATGIAISRAQAVREILTAWADGRRSSRTDDAPTAGKDDPQATRARA